MSTALSNTYRDTTAWQAADREYYLHPFTDHGAMWSHGSRVITRADGVYLYDVDGRRILDGLSGLGCVNVGYGQAALADAAAEAMRNLPFCHSFFETTHPDAVRLAERLIGLAPSGLSKVFFQASGSEANETAARLARRYWEVRGKPEKQVLISRHNAYHGSTLLTASLSGIPPLHSAGGPMPLPDIEHIPAPYQYLHAPDADADAFGRQAAAWLEERILAIGPERVAAFFGEPVQGAGGAIIPPDSYWPEIRRICDRYDVLLAVDEVVCGFGRLGEWLGCHAYDIARPDFIQLAKGITSAYAPLSATLISGRVVDALVEAGGEWHHGFTYSGHPVCCAVALANIELIEREGLLQRVREEIAPYFAAGVQALADHPLVGDVRSVGLVAGLQLMQDRASRTFFPEGSDAGERCSRHAWQRGLALRAIETTMALMPPLVITREELDFVFETTRASLDATAAELGMI